MDIGSHDKGLTNQLILAKRSAIGPLSALSCSPRYETLPASPSNERIPRLAREGSGRGAPMWSCCVLATKRKRSSHDAIPKRPRMAADERGPHAGRFRDEAQLARRLNPPSLLGPSGHRESMLRSSRTQPETHV